MKRVFPFRSLVLSAALAFFSLPALAQNPQEVGTFNVPDGLNDYGISVGANGNVSTSNIDSGLISYFTPTGTLISSFQISGNPYLSNSQNGELYQSLIGDDTLGIYNPATGVLLNSFPTYPGPSGITFGNGNIYVSSLGGTIETFNSTGTETSSFATPGGYDLAFGPDGNLYQAGGNLINVYTPAGVLLRTITIPGAEPTGIRFDGGKLLVTSSGTNALYVLNPSSGAILGQYNGIDGAYGLAIAPNGEAYVIGFYTNQVSIFTIGTEFGQTPGLTPNQRAIGTNIDGFNGGFSAETFGGVVVQALSNLPTTQLGTALDELSPQEFGQFTSKTAFNNASFETEAMDNYLAGQRDAKGNFYAGKGGIDSSGLVINDPSYDPNLATVHSRLMAWNPAPSNGTVSDVANPLLGGVDMKNMKDSKDMKAMSGPAYTDPWNFFVRGSVILAQGFSSTDVSHFDDNTESVVLGTDYRINSNFLVGLTAGYGHTDVTLDDSGSSATVDSYSPGFYASYADHGWYANLLGDYVHNAYTQQRNINFLSQSANSAPEGNEGVANLDGGYDFHHGALTFGPLAGLQYTHLSVDGYNETGSAADLTVNDQESDSLRSRLGGRVSYAFSHFGLNFTPHLGATWQHEFMDQARGISSSFDNTGLGSFSVRTENPSRDSALVDAGLDAEINRTATVFADYIAEAGQSNYFGQSVQAGVKIGF